MCSPCFRYLTAIFTLYRYIAILVLEKGKTNALQLNISQSNNNTNNNNLFRLA